MPNLYGVSNPVIAPVYFTNIGGSSIITVANTETPIATSPALAAISAGVYYPMIVGNLFLYCQSGALTGFNVFGKIGAGADFQLQGWQATAFPANAVLQLPVFLVGPPSTVPWQGAGSHVLITINPTGQAVTNLPGGTYAVFTLLRAPDQ